MCSKQIKPQKVSIVNLGCVRNLVDSQEILGKLRAQGHDAAQGAGGDTVILNTCSFIEDAKQETIDTLLDLLELKKQGKIKRVVVAGCFAQRYPEELIKDFEGVDAIIGVPSLSKEKVQPQVPLTPDHFRYVKICESCYNQCSFCAIPKIKGKFCSRKMDSVLDEVRQLDFDGVKELILVGQDITAYGIDIYGEKSLATLLTRICKEIKNIEWVRLLYTFPAHITDELIDVIAKEEKICKYVDVPFQHVSDSILSSMNRNFSAKQTRDLVKKLRDKIPGVFIRTSLIVGLPGETDENFEELKSFAQERCDLREWVFLRIL